MLFQKLMGKGPASMVSPSAPKTLWAWGAGYLGGLGLGDGIYRSSPTQVGALTTWSQVAADGRSRRALKTDGTLWVWGDNTSGQLGLGDILHRSSPVQVGALAVWTTVALGTAHTQAIKIDGTLWAWGTNTTYGTLGDGTLINRSSPVQIGTLGTWSSVTVGGTNNSALKTDGTLWSWGQSYFGPLGLGTAGPGLTCSSPTQVGTLNTWRNVSAGTNNRLAVKTDGTLWGIGRNNKGQLGLGDLVLRSSPVQIGTLANWSALAPKSQGSLAIKTDGTLWAWGYNNGGGVGSGDGIDRSSPVQVGTLATWTGVVRGAYASLAIRA